MSSFEKAGVLFITGLVAVILALALFGTSGSGSPAPESGGATDVGERDANEGGSEAEVRGAEPPGGSGAPVGDDLWDGLRDRVDGRQGGADATPLDPREIGGGSAAPAREHVVRAGDRLSNIAKQYLGDSNGWKAIAEANPGVDPSRLRVGQKLVIPDRALVAAGGGAGIEGERTPEPERKSAPPARKPTYIVKKGDTLTSIAQRELRDRAAWRKLFDMNKHVVKNANRLPVGVTLTLPAN